MVKTLAPKTSGRNMKVTGFDGSERVAEDFQLDIIVLTAKPK